MSKQEKIIIIENVRLTVYAVLLLFVLFSFIIPFKYTCKTYDVNCPLCGLRTAILQLINLEFTNAFDSNKLIVLFVVFFAFIVADTTLILIKRKQHQNVVD